MTRNVIFNKVDLVSKTALGLINCMLNTSGRGASPASVSHFTKRHGFQRTPKCMTIWQSYAPITVATLVHIHGSHKQKRTHTPAHHLLRVPCYTVSWIRGKCKSQIHSCLVLKFLRRVHQRHHSTVARWHMQVTLFVYLSLWPTYVMSVIPVCCCLFPRVLNILT